MNVLGLVIPAILSGLTTGAVYALVAEDGQVTVWPSEIPSELVPYPEPTRRDAPRDRR